MKNLFFAFIALATLSITSCKKTECGPHEHPGTVIDQFGRPYEGCIPDVQLCTTCGTNTDTTTFVPNPGETDGTFVGYIHGAPQGNVYEFKRDLDGNLVYVTTSSGNKVTSPTIWGVKVFNAAHTQSRWMLLQNGESNPGAGQKITDYFVSNPNSWLEVTFEENSNGDPFGELQNGTKMLNQITGITALGI